MHILTKISLLTWQEKVQSGPSVNSFESTLKVNSCYKQNEMGQDRVQLIRKQNVLFSLHTEVISKREKQTKVVKQNL